MTDLARRAGDEIAKFVEAARTRDSAIAPHSFATIIGTVGVLVSHEDAALLRQVKRLCDSRGRLTFQDKHGKWYGFARSSDRVTLVAALKSALDAAGVPDAKGT